MRKISKKAKGVTLISLVITIIVLLILAGVTMAMLTSENGILKKADKATLSAELSKYKEELELYKGSKYIENADFKEETLTAGKENLTYNTQKEGETGNIKTVINSITDEYFEKLEVIKGKLLINTKDMQEIEVAQSLGIEVNPYEIDENGVLLSSDGNLLLMDKNTGSLTIPDSVTAIGEGAFANLEGLKTVIIPGTVKRIETNAFRNNKDLERVIMKEGVEYIGFAAFQECTNLKTVEMANTINEIKNQAFYNDTSIENINFPTSLTIIEAYVFCGCKSIKNIEILEGIKEIKNYAFARCSNLQKVKISSTVSKIDGTAFNNCSNLKNIEIADGNKYFKFTNGILLGNDSTEMVIILESAVLGNRFIIPNTVKKLFDNQIGGLKNVTVIEIPASVESLSGNFITASITEVLIDKSNPNYGSDGKMIYTKDENNKELVKYYANEDNVIVDEKIKSIKSYAFQSKNLKTIQLPETLEKIEGQAFGQCYNLKKLSLGTNIKTFNNMSIYNSGIEEIEFIKDSNGDTNPNYSIINGALYNKDGTVFISPVKPLGTITSYEIPEGVKEIANNAFHNQNKMTSIKIPETVEKIGVSFNYCSALESIEIPKSVKQISTACFANATNLKKIKINQKQGSIPGSPWNCMYGDKAVKWE